MNMLGNELVLLHKVISVTSAEFVTIMSWTGEPGYRYRVNEIFYDTTWLGADGNAEVEMKIDGKTVDSIKNDPDTLPDLYLFLIIQGRLTINSLKLRFRSDGTNEALIEFYLSMIKEKI